MADTYDVIIVGARCAGSPTAMLLARAGARVLLIDRAGFPSDTVSTHFVHPPGVAALRRWGLLDTLVATGCPPVTTYRYDFGPFTVAGSPLPAEDGVATAFGPRRTVLDEILLDAAVGAGADVRQHFTVEGLVVEDGRVVGVRGRDARAGSRSVEERAGLVVGADGRHSVVAEAAAARAYRAHPPFSVGYYAYWSGVPVGELDLHLRPARAVMGFTTNDGLACLVVAVPYAEMPAFRRDVEGNYLRGLALVDTYADLLGAAKRESRIAGMAIPSFYRQPYGPGWALVGDARCDRDPCTAQGITSAFHDAEALAGAWRAAHDDGVRYGEAMAGYQRRREEQTLPMYELTCALATLEPPPPDLARSLAAAAADEDAAQRFVSVIAGTLPVDAFFAAPRPVP